MNDWLFRNGVWLVLIGGLLLGSLFTSTIAFLFTKHPAFENKLRPFDLVNSVLWLIVLYSVIVVRH
jgi:hypothetical protein